MNEIKLREAAPTDDFAVGELLVNAFDTQNLAKLPCQSAPKIHPLSASNFDPLVV
ncbi:hypothetical protein HFN87_35550 [Rhizobium laguerreae]|uniref:hypothetical protein n=1 Tax=Rhizobium laguerreae TaxID=1076926 RepID=UPI001C9161BF|nr:hypothetical protein [Rhizobium laguerreae]MBY3418534.1 hypothetical protein [Rhizobium laguerreae]